MNRIGIGNLHSRHDMRNIEVRIGTLGFTNTKQLRRQSAHGGCPVRRGVNRNGFYSHFAAGTDDM